MAHWSFDDCTAKDNSGNGHDGSINGNPQCVEGVRGKAFSFDGSNDLVTTILPTVKKTYSVSMFAKFNNSNIANNLFYLGRNTSYPDRLGFLMTYPEGGYAWHWGAMDIAGTLWNTPSHWSERADAAGNPKDLINSQWYNLVFVLNDTDIALYVDGKLLGNKKSPYHSEIESYSNLKFMLGMEVEGHPMNGQIDDLRIYNRALSEAEIQQLYKGEDSQPKGNADLNMSISTPSSVSLNQKNTYTFTIANPSKINATGVKAHFVVPRKSVATMEIPQNCTLNGRIIECKLSDLNAGQSATQTLSMTVLKKGALNLVGLVNSSDDDANYDDNKTSVVLSVK